MQEGFVRMETSLERLYSHVDGFMKLHETLTAADPKGQKSLPPLRYLRNAKCVIGTGNVKSLALPESRDGKSGR